MVSRAARNVRKCALTTYTPYFLHFRLTLFADTVQQPPDLLARGLQENSVSMEVEKSFLPVRKSTNILPVHNLNTHSLK